MIATSTYSGVVRTQSHVALSGPEMATQVQNGSLDISFSIKVQNPSSYVLHIQSVSWFVYLMNGTTGPGHLTTLGTDYIGPTLGFTISKASEREFTFHGIVSDRALISKIQGFVNYSKTQGHDYTLEGVPYLHQFSLVASIGDFKHDYLRELYLNDLVTVDLTYSSEVTQ